MNTMVTGTVDCPAGTGNFSITGLVDPKAIAIKVTGNTADGTTTFGMISVGFGTYRGSTVVQNFISVSDEDGIGTADNYRQNGTDAIAVIHNGSTGAEDMQIELVSMDADEIVLNCSNPLTGAKIDYVVYQGDFVADAIAFTFAADTGSATQDVTLPSGVGQPDLIMLTTTDQTTITTEPNYSISFGFAKKGELGRHVLLASDDGAGTSAVLQSIHNNRIITALEPSTMTTEGRGSIDVNTANWPTDGFEIDWESTPTFAFLVYGLAIRFTSDVVLTTGEGSAPIAGGLPVVQTLTAGGGTDADGLLVINTRTATANTQGTTGADVGAIGIGAYDGNNENWLGNTDDDGNATAQNANRQWTNAKIIRNYDMAATPALTSEGDGAFSGADGQISWNDIDATAFLYQWCLLTEVAAAAPGPAYPHKHRSMRALQRR
jgi:hypothetical protein